MTSTSANILDLIFTDSPGFVTAAGTLPPLGTSKHAVVYCLCNRNVTREKPYKTEIWKYQDADRDGLNIAIGDFPFDDILPDDINQATEIWTHIAYKRWPENSFLVTTSLSIPKINHG